MWSVYSDAGLYRSDLRSRDEAWIVATEATETYDIDHWVEYEGD